MTLRRRSKSDHPTSCQSGFSCCAQMALAAMLVLAQGGLVKGSGLLGLLNPDVMSGVIVHLTGVAPWELCMLNRFNPGIVTGFLVACVLVLAGCGGFPESDTDGTTDPGDDNRVTMGGIVFDNRFSDELTSVWLGTVRMLKLVSTQGLLDFDGYRSEVTWTRECAHHARA